MFKMSETWGLGQFRHDSVNQGGGDSRETLVSGMEWKEEQPRFNKGKQNQPQRHQVKFSGKTLATSVKEYQKHIFITYHNQAQILNTRLLGA